MHQNSLCAGDKDAELAGTADKGQREQEEHGAVRATPGTDHRAPGVLGTQRSYSDMISSPNWHSHCVRPAENILMEVGDQHKYSECAERDLRA